MIPFDEHIFSDGLKPPTIVIMVSTSMVEIVTLWYQCFKMAKSSHLLVTSVLRW